VTAAGLDFSVIQRALPFLLEGLALSFFLTAVAMLGGVVLGLALAVVRLSRWKVAAIFAAGYVNGFRAIPLVVCTENLIRVDDVMESPKLAQ
jgi:glutamate/aspartate transport system permease protein